ncbi:MarR family transcriptional regulator [Haloplanus sp. C73]|uniref:MarR family transcriptional regulator n=1 Tax=Haloplanus sp. C73 TaxID=3421641 RepID=UPI003EBD1A34
MSQTQTIGSRPTTQLDVPDELNASDSKLVYLFVAASDGATVDDLAENLDLKKITLFPVLDILSKRNLIDRIDGEYVPTSA